MININKHKSTTMDKLAEELKVSIRTIRIDVAYLKNVVPEIKTKRGKYGGGIYIETIN